MEELRLESTLPLNQYLVRPKRLPGEGLSAWLNRHFLMNGLPLPWRLRSQIILSYRHRRDPEPRIQLLDRLNGLLPAEAQVQPESWVAWCFEQPPTNKADWRSSSRQYYPQGFCPACMSEWGYFQELWEIPVVTACPRHGLQLVSVCSECGHDMEHWEWVDGRYQCQCGLPLEDFTAEPADRLQLAWARVVASHSKISLPSGYSFGGNPSSVALRQLLQLERVLGSLRFGATDEYRLLFDWPEYPRTVLRRLVQQVFANDEQPTKLIRGKGSIAFALCLLLRKLHQRSASLIESLVRAELNHHCLFVFADAALFINPQICPGGTAPVRQKFACWWRGINWDDGTEDRHVAPSYHSPCRFHRPLVIGIMMTLFRLAESGFAAGQLSSIWQYWYPSPTIRMANDPNGLIDEILRELYRLRLEPLRGLADSLRRLNGGCLVGYD